MGAFPYDYDGGTYERKIIKEKKSTTPARDWRKNFLLNLTVFFIFFIFFLATKAFTSS